MRSIWEMDTALPAFPTLEGDRQVDVLIIGGGLTGLLTAYMLAREGINYVLVDQGRLLGGTSGHTTAKITLQHGLIYQKLLRRFGREQAGAYYEANRHALESYRTLCRKMDCDFREEDSYIYVRSHPEKLHRELYALERIGGEGEFSETPDLPFSTLGAVRIPGQAQFHPLKFAAAISRGLDLHENTPIRGYDGRSYLTDTGHITPEKTVVATHFPIFNKHGLYPLKLYQHRSYVLALEQTSALAGMYMDGDQAGFSLRMAGERLLLGGGAHRTGGKGGGWTPLEALMEQHYPGAKTVARWAAQDCMTLDDVPYIGPYSTKTPNLFVATGYGKWGITTAMAAAELLRDQILGRPNAFGALTAPDRSILRPRLVSNVFHAVGNLMTPTRPRCPHLGCALKWNPRERTWDCPCHGSRFSGDGSCLEGPATGNIRGKV